jgi:WD40 repeat protein
MHLQPTACCLQLSPELCLSLWCHVCCRPGRYVLRSCVGGATSGFVACGAEDCLLRIWSRVSGEQLACLSGPAGCVNAVAWHPRNPSLIACASDDATIRTWLAPVAHHGRTG